MRAVVEMDAIEFRIWQHYLAITPPPSEMIRETSPYPTRDFVLDACMTEEEKDEIREARFLDKIRQMT